MQNLKNTLLGNAIFSGLSGLILLFGASTIAELMGIGSTLPLQFIGAGLVLFSGFLFWVALRSGMPPKLIRSIILMDWMWVVGSGLIIIAQAFDLTSIGFWIIGGIALVVANFAFLQQRFLSKVNS